MRNPLLFLVLALFLYQTLSFTCSTVPTQTRCLQLNGCSWGTSCTGSYIPSCVPPACYYVDSYSTAATTETGQLDNPMKTISAGIVKLANTTGTVIVLNYIDNVTAIVNQLHTVSAGVTTIRALWTDYQYIMDLNQAPLPSATQIYSYLKSTAAATFIIGNAIINYTYTGNQYTLDNQGGIMTLNNVTFVDLSGSKGTTIRQTATTGVLTWNGGGYSNSSVKFAFAGTVTINDVRFDVTSGSSSLIATSSTITLDGVNVRGDALNIGTTFLTLSTGSSATIKNSIFEKNYMYLVTTTNAKRVTITNTTFEDLAPAKPTLFYFKDIASDGTGNFLIEDCTFKDIVVPSSILMAEKNGINVTYNNVTMTNIKKSTTVTEDSQYASEWVGGLCGLTRNDAMVTILKSNFTDINGHCFGIKQSALNITGSNFTNSGYTKPTLNANMLSSLNDKSGITWVNVEDVTSSVAGGTKIILTGNNFLNNNAIAKYGGAIRLIGVMASQLIASGNVFSGNTAFYGGAIYSSNNLNGFVLSNNIFSQNSAYDGGAIYKKSTQFNGKIYTPSITINGDQFTENSALRNGGAMLSDWESLCMQGVTYAANTALNGGAIYIINLDQYYNNLYGCIKNTQFVQNSATDVGGAMKIYFDYSLMKEDVISPAVFNANTAYKGNDVSSERPTYYLFSFYDVLLEKTFSEFDDLSEWVSNSTRTSFAFSINTSNASDIANKRIIQKSGHELTQILKIEIMNQLGTVVDYVRGEQISVALGDYVNTINNFVPTVAASPVIFTFSDGRIYMKNTIQIMGEPTTTANLTFTGLTSTSNLLTDAGLLLDVSIAVYFQDCEVGDIFDTTARTCSTCASGTYSLADPYSDAACVECDKEKADCLGGAKIAVLPGFWRYSANSATIMECPADQACLGGLVDEKYYEVGVCAPEYQGNLCNKCISNYAKFGSSDSCVDCKRDGIYYLKFVGFFALQVAAVVYSVKVNLSKITSAKKARSSNNMELSKKLKNEDFQSNLMKIVVNFLQVSSLIVQYKFEWPDFILEVWEVYNKFVPTEKDGFSIDCIVAVITQDNRYLQFIKLVVTLFQPLGLWVALVLGYMVILKIQKEKLKGNPKLKKNVIVLFIITAFIIQPGIVQATLEMFKCQNLRDPDDPTYFMTKDPQMQCWTAFHIMWSVGIALPFFLLWGVVGPLLLFRKLKSTEKDLQDTEVYSRYAFVYVGLKSKRYYWEFINLIRKTLLIIIFVFLNMVSIQTQAFATFLVILTFGVAHVKCRPYNDKRLNRLELLSLITLGVMTYSGMFFLSGGSTGFTTILLIVIAFIFNLLFFLVTGIYFIRSYRKSVKQLARGVTKKIRGSLDKVISRRSSDSNNSSLSSDKKDNSIVDANQIGEMLSEINVQLQPEVVSPKSSTDPSHIPSEEDSSRADKKTVYADRKEEANYSIMKNSGYYNPPLSLQNSGYNLPGLSGHNSTVGLLSPAGHRQFSFLNADRFLRPLNSMDVSHQDDNMDTPGTPPRAKSRFASGFEDTPRRGGPGSPLKLDELLVLKNAQSSPRRSQNDIDGDERK